jgi:hypothetical protein
MNDKELQSKEARIFGKYLTGTEINDTAIQLYIKAITIRDLQSAGRDLKLEKFIFRFPFWIGFIDAALAMTNKQSILRKKIFVMLAVLETIPEYSHLFLSKENNSFALLKIFFVGIRSVYRFVFGFILVKSFRKI